ncbi:MAG TPA: hypothetical protein VF772_11030, partial [Terriglobales bacterium]
MGGDHRLSAKVFSTQTFETFQADPVYLPFTKLAGAETFVSVFLAMALFVAGEHPCAVAAAASLPTRLAM